MTYGAVYLAAGLGTRYGEKKQDIVFHGKELWRYAYETILKVVDTDRVVVVGKDIEGGETRSGSVINGLRVLPKDTERVIIAEAARPMLLADQVTELLKDTHPSTTFVRPPVNSPIYRDGTFIDRSDLYDLLVPQAFDYQLLCEAYESGRFVDTTDETRVMWDYHGIKPHFIETGSNLFKVTYPGDLSVIETFYQMMQEQ